MPEYEFTFSNTVPLETSFLFTAGSVKRKQGKRVLREATKVVVLLEQERELRGFVVKTRKLVEWKCVSLFETFCNNPDCKYMSAVRRSVAVKRPCHRCMVSGTAIICDRMDNGRSL